MGISGSVVCFPQWKHRGHGSGVRHMSVFRDGDFFVTALELLIDLIVFGKFPPYEVDPVMFRAVSSVYERYKGKDKEWPTHEGPCTFLSGWLSKVMFRVTEAETTDLVVFLSDTVHTMKWQSSSSVRVVSVAIVRRVGVRRGWLRFPETPSERYDVETGLTDRSVDIRRHRLRERNDDRHRWPVQERSHSHEGGALCRKHFYALNVTVETVPLRSATHARIAVPPMRDAAGIKESVATTVVSPQRTPSGSPYCPRHGDAQHGRRRRRGAAHHHDCGPDHKGPICFLAVTKALPVKAVKCTLRSLLRNHGRP
ncbi:hypothetical protein HPB47_027618 [Ixodes persulcatus]|uniref:Uncharacterized protein n=1 Tax=Ixodes persulcatus TaxID=34615 RepID=A0AC60PWY2_IXOPE|nr:hypothetical protein HPB47_027618 [Ixodes persulcatus]